MPYANTQQQNSNCKKTLGRENQKTKATTKASLLVPVLPLHSLLLLAAFSID